jgi:hypothetical protein
MSKCSLDRERIDVDKTAEHNVVVDILSHGHVVTDTEKMLWTSFIENLTTDLFK